MTATEFDNAISKVNDTLHQSWSAPPLPSFFFCLSVFWLVFDSLLLGLVVLVSRVVMVVSYALLVFLFVFLALLPTRFVCFPSQIAVCSSLVCFILPRSQAAYNANRVLEDINYKHQKDGVFVCSFVLLFSFSFFLIVIQADFLAHFSFCSLLFRSSYRCWMETKTNVLYFLGSLSFSFSFSFSLLSASSLCSSFFLPVPSFCRLKFG
jgi:hypothetical protein